MVVFAWFPPWALERSLEAQYIELDTSFRALRPHADFVVLEITANESTGPYHCFFSGLLALGITPQDIVEKAFLSDQHAALVFVCYIGHHFLCLRRLLVEGGLNS
jgi:hypothetical protein